MRLPVLLRQRRNDIVGFYTYLTNNAECLYQVCSIRFAIDVNSDVKIEGFLWRSCERQ